MPDIDLSDTSRQVPTCQTTAPFHSPVHAAVLNLQDLLQVMLLSDGSVTRHLQLLTDLPVQVVSLCSMSHKSNAWPWCASAILLSAILPHVCTVAIIFASIHSSCDQHLGLLAQKTCMGAQALKASVPLRIAWRCATWGLLQKACHQGWRQSLDPERSAR